MKNRIQEIKEPNGTRAVLRRPAPEDLRLLEESEVKDQA